jgi:DMSO/TMAO reductase YedYZ heme-binding membrane subunit
MNNIILIYILFAIIAFFLLSALIMWTYNGSIVKMNDNWKEIDYKTSMIFTLFLSFTLSLSGYRVIYNQ